MNLLIILDSMVTIDSSSITLFSLFSNSDNSTPLLLNRYIEIQRTNSIVYRQLIKDLQRLKHHVLIDKQARECIRSIEARLYKFDCRKRFNEILIKKLENHLKFILLNSYQQHYRIDICKKVYELIETYVYANVNEYSSEQFLNVFFSQINQDQLRSSTVHYRYVSSDATISTVTSSLQSL